MVHIHNETLFSHKKEWIWVSTSEVDEPKFCYTEWSKSEREKRISYIDADIWHLEKWYHWTYLLDRNRDADVNNRFVDKAGEGDGRVNWENSTETYILPYVK